MVVQGNWTLGDLSAGERGGERTVRDIPQNISGVIEHQPGRPWSQAHCELEFQKSGFGNSGG